MAGPEVNAISPSMMSALMSSWKAVTDFARYHKVAAIAAVVLILLLAIAAFAPLASPFDPDRQKLLLRLLPPLGFERAKEAHWLGTDQLGRDMLSRCIHGMRLTIALAFFGSIVSVMLGSIIGLIAGLAGGLVDDFLMSIVDMMLSLPFVLVALLLISVAGSDLLVLVLVLGFANWPQFARLIRAQVISLRDLPYVDAARVAGSGPLRIAAKHMVPNMISPIVVMATLNFSNLILLESALSFIGLGVQPPTATLGSMVGQGRDYMVQAPWVVMAPAAFIILLSLLVMILGDFLRDHFDVRLRER